VNCLPHAEVAEGRVFLEAWTDEWNGIANPLVEERVRLRLLDKRDIPEARTVVLYLPANKRGLLRGESGITR